MSFLLKDNTRDSSSMRVFCQERVRIATRIEGLSDISDMSNGILIDAAHPRSLDDIEEHFFEFYRDAAESVTGLPITVTICLRHV